MSLSLLESPDARSLTRSYRLADKPSKQFLVDALDTLSAFVKVQRRKLPTKTEKKRRTPPTHTPAPTPAVAGPSNLNLNLNMDVDVDIVTGPPPADVEDVDERVDTPPPPLEPATPSAAPAPLFTFYTGMIPGPPQPGAGPAAGPAAGPGGTLFGGPGLVGGGFGGMEDVD